MKTAEDILENCLNEVGLSINEKLKPNDIPLRVVKKTKKAIIAAMEEYANERLQELSLTDEDIEK